MYGIQYPRLSRPRLPSVGGSAGGLSAAWRTRRPFATRARVALQQLRSPRRTSHPRARSAGDQKAMTTAQPTATTGTAHHRIQTPRSRPASIAVGNTVEVLHRLPALTISPDRQICISRAVSSPRSVPTRGRSSRPHENRSGRLPLRSREQARGDQFPGWVLCASRCGQRGRAARRWPSMGISAVPSAVMKSWRIVLASRRSVSYS
jgi:hypothetical protein